jgi:hypothetical protein
MGEGRGEGGEDGRMSPIQSSRSWGRRAREQNVGYLRKIGHSQDPCHPAYTPLRIYPRGDPIQYTLGSPLYAHFLFKTPRGGCRFSIRYSCLVDHSTQVR